MNLPQNLLGLFSEWRLISLAIVLATLVLLTVKVLQSKLNSSSETTQDGVVILHQLPPTPYTPCPSPYCLKLETFLRMVKIPYSTIYGYTLSSKGKVPWIEYNGVKTADSNFIVEFLCKEFGITLDSQLSSTERAVAHSFLRMIEENTFFTMKYNIWIDEYDYTKAQINPSLPFYMRPFFCAYIQYVAKMNLYYGHGISRHSSQEVYKIAEQDLTSLSEYLEEKDFIMGDTPCLVDTAAFGLLAQCLWLRPKSPHAVFIKEHAQNLERFCVRMKERFFPDWEELLCTD